MPMKLRTLLGDYPNTVPLKRGDIKSPLVEFDYAEVAVPHDAFKQVTGGQFDVAELAIMTYMQSRAWGKPLVALPLGLSGRFQHGQLAYNSDFGVVKPDELQGKKVGVRTYPQTTPTWVRGILQHDYGIQIDQVKWITFEDGHVPEYKDPAFTERAPQGQTFMKMLLAGQIDAAVVMANDFKHPNIKTVIPNPGDAAAAWYRKYGAVQLNHVLVVRESLSQSHPEIVREIYRMFAESKRVAAEPPGKDGIDTRPVGYAANRRNFEVAAQFALEQGIIPRALALEELFDDTTRVLD